MHRRHLTPSQVAIVIGVKALPHYEEEAKKRQVRKPDSVPANLPEQKKGDSREQAAKALGISPRLISDAKRIVEQAPDLAEKVRDGEMTVHAAVGIRWKRKAPLPATFGNGEG